MWTEDIRQNNQPCVGKTKTTQTLVAKKDVVTESLNNQLTNNKINNFKFNEISDGREEWGVVTANL